LSSDEIHNKRLADPVLKHRSIFKELKRHYAVIILVMSISSLTLFLLSRLMFGESDLIIDQNVLFNNYLVAMNEVRTNLDSMIRQEKFDNVDRFYASRDIFLLYARDLVEKSVSEELWRSNMDLYNLAVSCTDEARSAVRLMVAGYSPAAFPIYDNARYMFYLTSQYYYRSYNILLSVVEKDRLELVLYRSKLNVASIILIASLIGISSFLAQKLSELLTFPIAELTRTVTNAAVSEHDIELISVDEYRIEEYESLARAYNAFSSRINAQFIELKRNSELERKLHEEETKNLKIKNLLKESELKALQSRINPHFLFNSINMIKNVAYIEGAEQASDLLESFGSFLRYNYDKFNKIVTIADEYRNIRDYFLIQKIRMGDRLNYTIDFEDRILGARIPCLVIQPLVENSINHGVGKYLENAFVGVKAGLENDRLILRVYDNGVGIDSHTLATLNSVDLMSELNGTAKKSIGISNVISRLKIFFNDDISYNLFSDPGIHTGIFISLPFTDGG